MSVGCNTLKWVNKWVCDMLINVLRVFGFSAWFGLFASFIEMLTEGK